MGTFSLQLAEFAKKAGDNASLVVQKVALDIFGRVVMRTPVDSGRARGNWQLTVGQAASGEVARDDKASYGSPPSSSLQSSAAGALASFQLGPSIFIVNNLPYINRLEYDGYSKQAPAGMVRVSVVEFQGLVAKALAELPQ
ncbi:HK97 gp10 family phage protein [Variovorax sp. UMC13]|uniref:HK97 gp10 family phage protein n=1 Tax=Variovorax sp. UMC13 TaxID=1862326 RepID=UPI001601C2A3|nr:HK97 gp10 family phage protein [Variovorax sp. UMC13]MBB1599481.1 hypothetical protein [Variovorax sp. UMC13]